MAVALTAVLGATFTISPAEPSPKPPQTASFETTLTELGLVSSVRLVPFLGRDGLRAPVCPITVKGIEADDRVGESLAVAAGIRPKARLRHSNHAMRVIGNHMGVSETKRHTVFVLGA